MKQGTVLRQTTHLATSQILVAQMVQATNDELEQLIVSETERNLVIEMVDPSEEDTDYTPSDDTQNDSSESDVDEEDRYADSFIDYSDDEPEYSNLGTDTESYSPCANYKSDHTFRDELNEQLEEMDLTEDELFLSHFLVNSLDDRGYLLRSISELVDDLSFTQMRDVEESELERVLTDIVQTLEPAGIGARNLKECLTLQLLETKSSEAALLALKIVEEAFDELTHHHYEQICTRFGINSELLSAALKIISKLNPSPGGQGADSEQMELRASHIKPDFLIHNVNGELDVRLNKAHIPSVRISPDYELMLERIQKAEHKTEDEKQGMSMIRNYINQGNVFIDALRQRQETLLRVIIVIASLQKDFFLNGGSPEDLRPMGLQDVANQSGYDISTISRVSNSKFIETDFGIISVKELFTFAVQNDSGESISNTAVQEALRNIIENEDKHKPLSDDALAEALKKEGYPVARRTVTKYRELLKYPSAKLRRII